MISQHNVRVFTYALLAHATRMVNHFKRNHGGEGTNPLSQAVNSQIKEDFPLDLFFIYYHASSIILSYFFLFINPPCFRALRASATLTPQTFPALKCLSATLHLEMTLTRSVRNLKQAIAFPLFFTFVIIFQAITW